MVVCRLYMRRGHWWLHVLRRGGAGGGTARRKMAVACATQQRRAAAARYSSGGHMRQATVTAAAAPAARTRHLPLRLSRRRAVGPAVCVLRVCLLLRESIRRPRASCGCHGGGSSSCVHTASTSARVAGTAATAAPIPHQRIRWRTH